MKRTSRSSSVSSSGSVTAARRSHKRFRSTSYDGDYGSESNGSLRVYIVQAKLDEKTIRELHDLIEQSSPPHKLGLDLCNNAADADIILTNIRMKKRLERHVDWKIAKQKAIVTPDWLRESAKQKTIVECGHYAALPELHDETVKHCPEEDVSGPSQARVEPSSSRPPPIVKPTNPRIFKNWAARYACTRASPLVCVNQALAAELEVLRRHRELESLSINALSYERSVALIKAYPNLITWETYERDVTKLSGLGDKTLSKIEEFIKNGYIEETRTIRASERFQSLPDFASIYSIGPANARKLYDLGLRTIQDLERYYDVPPGCTVESLQADLVQYTPNGIKIPRSKVSPPDMSIKIALALREELEIPIPREEVEEVHSVVMKELHEIQPGCVSTIVGGYRRGKPESNDVDIVFSHPDLRNGGNLVKGLCAKLTNRLHSLGLITHAMHLSGFHAPDALRTETRGSLEKVLTVFILPESASKAGTRKRLHRRLDLIFATPAAYWTAVVGWTGSRMFERDLRLWAKVEKGMKFDSTGLTRRHDSKLLVPKSEEEVFEILGLDWIDPTMRNANA
ncbi:hypothetical protein M413DRAFT_446505 [Hebeloma cylindrosporum]|uniref:DNA-directed DNA polymerase n=1 Tax=Hebeloma cylindrosporum TaxID=76867 RepID=A0A0C3C9Q4_HEBCY|nr:hypothetical protein M413DRAFT_446505 [Hebeloma cylindrosporum h7]